MCWHSLNILWDRVDDSGVREAEPQDGGKIIDAHIRSKTAVKRENVIVEGRKPVWGRWPHQNNASKDLNGT